MENPIDDAGRSWKSEVVEALVGTDNPALSAAAAAFFQISRDHRTKTRPPNGRKTAWAPPKGLCSKTRLPNHSTPTQESS
ncbi:hypothetical protein PGT21_030595 [Puccinia graminis f. sp. tritici]|uniref:Uncharacterized protein n=1 Tax=Puccinia graminis f. sp. tritici TaxID=56615 RepID=A0A5B0MMA6_PUCGR|nr:hypothetical protein PGT21_030595 [Puccinia graminis f. sp. tritici]